MPKITVVIEYDAPVDPLWLNPDSVNIALSAYCVNTKFVTTWAPGGNPWAAPDTKVGEHSASTNSDYAAALKVFEEFAAIKGGDSIIDFPIWLGQRLHSGEPNVA